jgi:hypothetical protein
MAVTMESFIPNDTLASEVLGVHKMPDARGDLILLNTMLDDIQEELREQNLQVFSFGFSVNPKSQIDKAKDELEAAASKDKNKMLYDLVFSELVTQAVKKLTRVHKSYKTRHAALQTSFEAAYNDMTIELQQKSSELHRMEMELMKYSIVASIGSDEESIESHHPAAAVQHKQQQRERREESTGTGTRTTQQPGGSAELEHRLNSESLESRENFSVGVDIRATSQHQQQSLSVGNSATGCGVTSSRVASATEGRNSTVPAPTVERAAASSSPVAFSSRRSSAGSGSSPKRISRADILLGNLVDAASGLGSIIGRNDNELLFAELDDSKELSNEQYMVRSLAKLLREERKVRPHPYLARTKRIIFASHLVQICAHY